MPPRKPSVIPPSALEQAVARVEAFRAIKAEGAAAREWRLSAGLSRRELAEITGYSERTIGAYEAGQFDADKPVTLRALKSYRLACAAVALGVEFDWKSATMRLGPAVVTVPTHALRETALSGIPPEGTP